MKSLTRSCIRAMASASVQQYSPGSRRMISFWTVRASRRASTPWGVGFSGGTYPSVGAMPLDAGPFWVFVQSSASSRSMRAMAS